MGSTVNDWYVTQNFKDLDTIRIDGDAVPLSTDATKLTSVAFEVLFEVEVDLSVPNKYFLSYFNDVGSRVDVGVEVLAENKQQFFVDRIMDAPFNRLFQEMSHNVAPRIANLETTIRFHAVFDTASVEVLCDSGEVGLTALFFPLSGPLDQMKVVSPTSTNVVIASLLYLKSTVPTKVSTGSTTGMALAAALMTPMLVLLRRM